MSLYGGIYEIKEYKYRTLMCLYICSDKTKLMSKDYTPSELIQFVREYNV